MRVPRLALLAAIAHAAALVVVTRAQTSTNAPTTFPTKAPTTLTPTSSPTVPFGLCNPADEAIWEQFAVNFDTDLTLAGISCAFGVATESVEIEICVRNMFANRTVIRPQNMKAPPMSFPCSVCVGRYATCMVKTCDCIAARATSDRCIGCSATTCEPSFVNCTGDFVLPPYQPEFTPITQEQILIMAGSAGGVAVALLAGVGVMLYRRSSRAKRSEIGSTPEDEVMFAIRQAKLAMKTGAAAPVVAAGAAQSPATGRGKAAAAAAPPVPGRKGFMGFGGGAPAGRRGEEDPESGASSSGLPGPVSRKPFFSVRLPGRRAAPPSVPVRDYAGGLQTSLSNPVGHSFVVTMPFVGTNEDELTLTTNTRVTILEQVSDDWVNVRVDSTGAEGMVLSSHLRQA